MYQKFIQAFTWNSSAAFMYKISLMIHQIAVYATISHELYGMQSSLFALVYTMIALTNFGFDETLVPFFSWYAASKENCKHLLQMYGVHCCMIAIISIMLYGAALYSNVQIDQPLLWIIITLFCTENSKKSLVAMAQLAFYHRQLAYIQVMTLISYFCMVWGYYAFYTTISLITLFLPLLIASTIELLYITLLMQQWYKKLPQSTATSYIPFKGIFAQRCYNYSNQIIKAVYAPNSMTLFFAYALGFQQAATVKLYTTIITLVYTCITKTMGITSGAVLSSMNHLPLAQIRQFFRNITWYYTRSIGIMSIILSSIVGYAFIQGMLSGTMALHIFLFFTISLCEQICITYEQLLLSRHASKTIMIINGLSTLAICLCWYAYWQQYISIHIFITCAVSIKIICCYAIAYTANNLFSLSSQIQ